jgi:dTDP-4-dehydrorhamnose reductase
MKKKIIILGSSGMLGHVVTLYFKKFPNLFDVVDVSRTSNLIKPSVLLNVTDFDSLNQLIESENPNVIINCVGILNMNAEQNPADAILVNSYLPHFLEKVTFNTICKVIHISTDCVFSGKRGSYKESDYTDADGFYAKSKALGELNNAKDLTIRTSIIGPEMHTNGIGLFQWFSTQQGTINGYTEVYWTGVTTIELTKFIFHCLQTDLVGLYHLVNNDPISKFDLLNLFKQVFENSKVNEIVPSHQHSYDKSLLNTRKDYDYIVPNYLEMIYEMKKWILDYLPLYPHYTDILLR